MLAKFATLPLTQRFAVMVALAAAVAGLTAVALWTQQPDMQVLFTNLAADDAGSIVDRLKDMKVPYELGAGGTSILVPSAQVHDLRLRLAGQGLPHGGGLGFEIFDRSSLGVSEFVQKVNYRRALQGELARTIAQMPEVERARVHLSMPERRLFNANQERSRASVVLSLRGGQSLGKAQIQGIVHLVASSVEGLQPQDVTIVDGHGRLLSGSPQDDGARLTDSQLEYQRTLEKDIEGRIQTMLEHIVGANKAVVRVSSLLNFRQVETTEERYDPNGQVVRSEQRSQEKSAGTNGVSGGVPGVASNVPPGKDAEPTQSSTNSSQNKNEMVNYEISRTVSKIVEPIGTVKQLSAAVLVDGRYEPVKGDAGQTAVEGDAARKYSPRSEEEMKQIEEIVKKAMGYNADRGDEVQVVNAQFGFGQEEEAGTSIETSSSPVSWAQSVRYGVGTALFLLLLFFVVRPLIAVLTAPSDAGARAGLAAGGVGETGAALSSMAGGPSRVEGLPGSSNHAQILDMAKNNPESTALVVKQWLNNNV